MNQDQKVDGDANPRDARIASDVGPTDKTEAEELLEEKRKRNTSGLSWDEVAAQDKKGWHQITEMGEGD